MSKKNLPIPADFPILLKEIKTRIQQAQARAMLAVNAELVQLYWDIGRIIAVQQQQEGWDAAVIPRLARELANELPEVKGFSERNIGRMIAFYREYPNPTDFLPQPAAKLESTEKLPQAAAKLLDAVLWSIPWFHQVVLMEKAQILEGVEVGVSANLCEAVASMHPDGDQSNLRIRMNYKKACDAHRDGHAVAVTGLLQREAKLYHLLTPQNFSVTKIQ